MKAVFAILLLAFAGLYAVAQITLGRGRDQVVHLTWATDPNPARTQQCELFSRMYPGIRVTVDPTDRTKLLVRCATGTGPDLIDTSALELVSLAETGILKDLTPYAVSMGFGPDKTYPQAAKAMMAGGKQYRYPCNVWANALIYNKAIFADYGLAAPPKDWTWEQLIQIGRQIRQSKPRSGRAYLVIANWAGLYLVMDLLPSHGARFFSDDGLICELDSPQAIAALQLYHDLMHVHQIIPTPAESSALSSQGGWGVGGINWFSSGRAAMIIIGRWYLVITRNWPDIRPHLAAVSLPRVGDLPPRPALYLRGAAINSQSPHAPAAMKFLQYLASREYGQLIVRDGDSLPPNPQLARSGRDLVNDACGDPAFHQAFIDAVSNSQPLEFSPFVDAPQVWRWLQETVEKIENRLATPAQACAQLADEINKAIRQNLQRRPDLQQRYEQLTGKPYRDDWWQTRRQAAAPRAPNERP